MRIFWLLFSAVLSAQCTSSSKIQEYGLKSSAPYEKKLDSLFQSETDKLSFNGAVLITKNGKEVWKSAYGYSDLYRKTLHTTNSIFRVGSITKQFTAALILKLSEEGKLSLNDPISQYLNGLTYGNTVTLNQLLNHTSGIPNYYFFAGYHDFKKEQHTTDDMFNRIKRNPLEFEPGSNYKYSNSGYYLLGLITEKVTGLTWEKAIETYIIDPLALANTMIAQNSEKLSQGYKISDGSLEECDYINIKVPYSAGALISDVSDLNRWGEYLFNDFISAKSLGLMTTPGSGGYGLGLWVDSYEGYSRIWHTGGIDGFRSIMSYYPKDDVRIIILSNVEGYPIKNLESKVDSIIL